MSAATSQRSNSSSLTYPLRRSAPSRGGDESVEFVSVLDQRRIVDADVADDVEPGVGGRQRAERSDGAIEALVPLHEADAEEDVRVGRDAERCAGPRPCPAWFGRRSPCRARPDEHVGDRAADRGEERSPLGFGVHRDAIDRCEGRGGQALGDRIAVDRGVVDLVDAQLGGDPASDLGQQQPHEAALDAWSARPEQQLGVHLDDSIRSKSRTLRSRRAMPCGEPITRWWWAADGSGDSTSMSMPAARASPPPPAPRSWRCRRGTGA